MPAILAGRHSPPRIAARLACNLFRLWSRLLLACSRSHSSPSFVLVSSGLWSVLVRALQDGRRSASVTFANSTYTAADVSLFLQENGIPAKPIHVLRFGDQFLLNPAETDGAKERQSTAVFTEPRLRADGWVNRHSKKSADAVLDLGAPARTSWEQLLTCF